MKTDQGGGGPALVSCIVPVYNGERFLAEALASILAQTHKNIEIIVVDDGSTDGTPQIIEGLPTSVRALRQQNRGPAAARNAGVALATGSFMAFLDADDLWHKGKLERQLRRFEQRPELQISFATMRNVMAQGSVANVTADALSTDPLVNPENWPVIPFSPCTLLARRAAFVEVGPFNEALRRGEDTEWFVRMMMRKVPYEVIPDLLLDRRIHAANLTRESPPTPFDVVRMLKLTLDRRRAEGW